MRNFNVIQFALYVALFMAILGVLCGVIYPFVGHLIDMPISPNFPSWADVNIQTPRFWATLYFGLKWLWAGILFLLKWLLKLISIPWLFGFAGFLVGLVLGIIIKPFSILFGKS